ncbi:MAG: hypothetical protein WC119_01150 [Synergistaceae bacterium]
MKLRLYNINNKYAFSLDGFSSLHHYGLIPEVKPFYPYAWQALIEAKRIANDKPYHVRMLQATVEDLSKPVESDTPAEELLINHYEHMLREMSKNVVGIDDNSEEEKKITYMMVKSQVEDLLHVKEELGEKYEVRINKLVDGYRKIVDRHFRDYLNIDRKEKEKASAPSIPNMPQVPLEPGQPSEENLTMASSKRCVLNEEEIHELLEHYAIKACEAVSRHHPDIIPKVDPQNRFATLIGLDKGKAILKIYVNESCNINNIVSDRDLAEMFPSNSPKFYQRYWKPIVESIGHFFLDELDALIIPEMSALPDMPNGDGSFDMRGWNPYEIEEVPINLSFKKECPAWVIASGEKMNRMAGKYTEEDFLRNQPTRVRCIDENLDLFGKIGEVVQIVPINEALGFEVDVNFGRKIVRLTQDQLEILNGI